MSATLVSEATTHPGTVRPRNEDAFAAAPDASLTPDQQLAARKDLEDQAKAEAAGPGRIIATTVVILLARGEHFACLWAGDSRAYLLREGALTRLTRDHCVVQELVEAGLIDDGDAEAHPQANVITRAVGAQGDLELDKVSARIASGDLFLLCSDGLFKALPEAEMAAVLSAGGGCDALIAAALAAGARDNVTALSVRA